MRRRLGPVLCAALLIFGCAAETPTGSTDVPGSNTPAASAADATAGPTPTATPEPTPIPPVDATVSRFTTSGGQLIVEIRNPNIEWGLVRAPFEATLLDKDGTVLAVEGNDGLPGAPCCTIYLLGPGETYPLFLSPVKKLASVEIRVIGDWELWEDVAAEAPKVEVTGPKLRIRKFVGSEKDIHVTGRIEVDREGPFNVQVRARIDGPSGKFMWLSDFVDCVTAGKAYAFDIWDLAVPPKKAKLGEVVATVTTVPGFGATDQPPGC